PSMNGRMGWSGTLSLPPWIVIRAPLAGGSGLGLAMNRSPAWSRSTTLMRSEVLSSGHLPALRWESQRSPPGDSPPEVHPWLPDTAVFFTPPARRRGNGSRQAVERVAERILVAQVFIVIEEVIMPHSSAPGR